MFGRFWKQFPAPRTAQPAASDRQPAASRLADPDDPSVETIDDWFVRTTRMLLRRARPGAQTDGKRTSAHERRIDALEHENAALRADNERLSSEVLALRTLIYSGRRRPREGQGG